MRPRRGFPSVFIASHLFVPRVHCLRETTTYSALLTSHCCMASFLSHVAPGVFLVAVRAKPGARTSSVVGPLTLDAEAVEVRIAAQPIEGKANAELVDFVQSVMDTQVRELGAVLGADVTTAAVEAFFAGTAYTALSHAPHTRESDKEDVKVAKRGKTKAKKGSASSGSGSVCDSSSPPSTAPSLVARLRQGERCHIGVELSRGSTSKSKALSLTFPGSEAELVGLLQRIARE